MTTSATLDRLKHDSRFFIEHNAVSETLLRGPASALSAAEATAQLLGLNGTLMEWGNVTVQSNLTTLTQVAPVTGIDASGNPVYGSLTNWTTRFKVGDEIAIAGSTLGNNGIKVVATVSSGSLTVSTPMAAAESGLYYAKTTQRLLRVCEEQRLFAGGYETDTQLRAFLLNGRTTLQERGTRRGIVEEMNRVTNSTSTALLESAIDLTTLGTSVAYTHSTKTVAAGAWYNLVSPGDALMVAGSTRGSDGRYTVYGVSGTSVQLGHRANRSSEYVYTYQSGKTELLLREDRANNSLWVSLANQSGTTKTIAFTISVSGATWGSGSVVGGTATVSTTSTVATVSLQAGGGSTTARGFSEVRLPLNGLTSPTTFTLAITSGTPTAVRLGDLGLCPTGTDGTPTFASMFPWRWGGVVFTGLRSGVNETGLTVYDSAKPGWYVGVSYPESAEEDSYSMASPDELVVVEVDHRNPAYYNKSDLTALVRGVLLPADVEGILGLL